MKKFFSAILFASIFFGAKSQSNIQDSIVALNNLSQKYLNSSLDSSEMQTRKALLLNNGQFKNEVGRSQKLLGIIHYYQRNWDSALFYYNKSLANYKFTDNKEGKSAVLNNIALVYQDRGMPEKAIEFHIKALKIRKELGDYKNIAGSYNNLGNLYSTIGEEKKAIGYFNDAIGVLRDEQNTEALLADLYNNLGASYKNIGIGVLAEKFSRMAFKLRKQFGNKINIAISLMNIANSIDRNSNTDSIMAMYRLALQTFIDEKYIVGEATCLGNIANYLRYNKSYDSALVYYNNTIRICERYNLQGIHRNTIRDIALLYLLKGDLLTYEKYLFKYKKIDNDLLNKEKKQIIAELETKYKSIEQQLSIEKLEKKQEKQRAKIYRIQLYWIIAIALFFLTTLMIMQQYRLQQRKKRVALEKQKLEIENKVLRLQMNPHFLFNSLNSIQSFIAKNNTLEAEEYLAEFAQLVRLILESSTKSFIPLDEDLEILRLYLKLEKKRFEEKFDFEISIDEEIDEEFSLVPPMIVQPFIENSLKHGFSGINYKGKLNISYSLHHSDFIKCAVEDNGVGREASRKKQTRKTNTSLGILVTSDRLTSLNQESGEKNFVEFVDLIDEKGNPKGTRVEIIIHKKESQVQ